MGEKPAGGAREDRGGERERQRQRYRETEIWRQTETNRQRKHRQRHRDFWKQQGPEGSERHIWKNRAETERKNKKVVEEVKEEEVQRSKRNHRGRRT